VTEIILRYFKKPQLFYLNTKVDVTEALVYFGAVRTERFYGILRDRFALSKHH